MIIFLLLWFVLPKQEQKQKTEKTVGYSPLFFGNWGSSKGIDNKLPAGLDPAMERGLASNVGRILQMERDHWEQSRPVYFISPVNSFLLNFISQHNCWPRGSQPCSTPAQPSTDVTAKGSHIFRGNNISTGVAAADLLPKAFPSDSLGFITFPSSGSHFHLEPVELSRPGWQHGLQAIGTQLLVEK